MRKQITIPLSYNPAGNDIGNYNLISGYDYEFWYAAITQIRTVLGNASYDAGTLCKSSSINVHAAFKPTQYKVPTQPEHYHGMWPETGTIPYDWNYRKPTGGSASPYCIDHFLGYNHNAPIPGVQDVVPISPLSWLDFNTKETVIWEDFDPATPREVEIVLRLPEWDIRGFADETDSIDRVWVKSYLDSEDAAGLQMADAEGTDAVAGYTLTDAMITNRELDGTTFKFTPQNSTLWTGNIGQTDYKRPFWMKLYLGNSLGDDPLLEDNKRYYANFPSESGGVVEFAGFLQWRYYYEYVSVIWEKCEGGEVVASSTGSIKTKKDRKGIEADQIFEHYEDELGQGALFSGVYRVGGPGNNYYNYTDGIRGSVTTC